MHCNCTIWNVLFVHLKLVIFDDQGYNNFFANKWFAGTILNGKQNNEQLINFDSSSSLHGLV